MARVTVNDLDYLAARVHGRRGRVAEAQRLDGLCRLRTIPELARAIFPEVDLQTCAQFQRWTMEDLMLELSHSSRYLDEAGCDLLAWQLARFQVENMKVLLRGFLDHTPLEVVQEQLLSLPQELALDAKAFLSAESLERFVDRLPRGMPSKALRLALSTYRDRVRPFFYEAALDQGYFQELLARAGRLSLSDREIVSPMVDHEVSMFQLMLAVRGKFGYHLTPELLLPLHIRWCAIPSDRFNAMLEADDLPTAAAMAVGRAIDALPIEHDAAETATPLEIADVEALAWKRFLRLANGAFRRSHMGLGAIIGYTGIRRVEVANLITLSEGIRTGLPPEVVRARLVPRHDEEVTYV
jgi:V/A-type H+/Na+-transporting ATPase subunit C